MKKRISTVCSVISVILLIAFAVKVIADYTRYTPMLTSAPFYVWILADALLLVLPAIIVFAVGRIIRKKQ